MTTPAAAPRPPALTACDCAGCLRACLGDSWRAHWDSLPRMGQRALRREAMEEGIEGAPIAGRLEGRPYCLGCLRARRKERKANAHKERST